MAIYMFFHIGIAVLMLSRAQSTFARSVYGALILTFTFLLFQTGTRGTVLGLIGGSFLATSYIALFATQYKRLRTVAVSALMALVVVGAGFFAARDTAFVQSSPMLSRIANLSLSDGSIRFLVWDAAIKGVKEHPVFGWGQENFSYVFNKYYTPELFAAESWYDRSHNVVMDWLVTGGIVGAVAYFSILGSAIWYLFFRPLFRKGDESFTVTERGILIGLLAGYTVHNMFVFDNIVSYIFYAVILAYIHGRVVLAAPATPKKFDTRVIEQVAVPLVGIALVLTVYYVNVPSIRAAGDMIVALQATDAESMIAGFDRALSRGSFADQEIREQLMQRVQSVVNTPEIPADAKEKALAHVEEELLKQSEEKPNDARVEVFLSSFYRANSMLDKAADRLLIARELSPKKQIIIFEQGFTELQRGNMEAALAFFKEAYELAPQYSEARINYANAALLTGNETLFNELISTEEEKTMYALNDQAIQTVYKMQRYPQLIEMFKTRVIARPTVAQERANLAYVYDVAGNPDEALAVLRQAIIDIPSFKTQGEQFIAGIEAQRNSAAPIQVQVP